MRKEVMIIGAIAIVLLVIGCTSDYGSYPSSNIVEQDDNPEPPEDTGSDNSAQQVAVNDKYPSVSTTVSPSNPALGEPFELTITAEDDFGVKELSWVSENIFSNSDNSGTFDCQLQNVCSTTWELIAIEEGLHQFKVSVEDSSGKTMDNILAEANVGPSVETTRTDSFSNEEEPTAYFTCGNSVCEGGESYESCSDDCTPEDIIGTNPGNGACEPGEDADNAPNDCTIINKQCGNNVCDSGEDRLNCYYDCPNDGSSGESEGSCNSNQDCGSKAICTDGVCYSVDCRTDADCSGCRRCSYNSCVKCAQGPYGCSC